MLFLIFTGVVAFVFGLALLVSLQSVRNFEEKYNKFIAKVDESVYNQHIGLGISLLLVSLLCFFVVYYLIKKYG